MKFGFTEQAPEKLGSTEPSLTAIDPAAPVWGKKTFSAWAHGALRENLTGSLQIQHLLICGLETPICVYQTAVDARAAGLEVTILTDAVGARRIEDASACLETLRRAGVHTLPSETVFYSLLHDLSHPFFKPLTELVKSHA